MVRRSYYVETRAQGVELHEALSDLGEQINLDYSCLVGAPKGMVSVFTIFLDSEEQIQEVDKLLDKLEITNELVF